MNTQIIQAPAIAPISRMQRALNAEFCKGVTSVPHAAAAANNAAARFIANTNALATANKLIRMLQREHRVIVCRVNIALTRPRLYLKDPLPPSLPLAGIIRRRVDSEVYECSAILDDCEVMWAEFEDVA